VPDADPILYFDLASPYGYLAVERAAGVLGAEPRLEPVLLGAIFAHRGWGTWAQTAERERNMAEIERRARAYGLPLTWPPRWPANSLTAQRAAIVAAEQGRVAAFAHAAYRLAFVDGEDLTDVDVVLRAGQRAGLDPGELGHAVTRPRVKAALRHATDEAIAHGVMGVPSIRIGDQVLWGDDRLETARMLLELRAAA
jgi:2-hydroxychromene-2-carboxylate isomerase